MKEISSKTSPSQNRGAPNQIYIICQEHNFVDNLPGTMVPAYIQQIIYKSIFYNHIGFDIGFDIGFWEAIVDFIVICCEHICHLGNYICQVMVIFCENIGLQDIGFWENIRSYSHNFAKINQVIICAILEI